MKYVFIYFNQKALCENTGQVVDFINTLAYRGNGPNLICYEPCTARIQRIFDNPEASPGELTITGCGETCIRYYPALGDTMEEHDRAYELQTASQKERRIADNKARLKKIHEELNEIHPGRYHISLDYSHIMITDTGPKQVRGFIDTDVCAVSGADAYFKGIEIVSNDPDINSPSFRPAYSNGFTFYKIK